MTRFFTNITVIRGVQQTLSWFASVGLLVWLQSPEVWGQTSRPITATSLPSNGGALPLLRPTSAPLTSLPSQQPTPRPSQPTTPQPTAPLTPLVPTPLSGLLGKARTDETPIIRRGIDTRPFLLRGDTSGDVSLAIGGYTEFLGEYRVSEGLSDGWQMQARRFNLFVNSSITRFLRIGAEIEFEPGDAKVVLEMAIVDLRLASGLVIRGGIIVVPIGKFNIAHDGPIYDFVDRPLVSTRIIPSTYSDMGFGLTGAFYPGGRHKLAYEIYAINGLGAGLLSADPNGVRLSAGRSTALFRGDDNGLPAVVGRVSYEAPFGLEFGISGYAGIYNQPQKDGLEIDTARWLTLLAFDLDLELGPVTLRGEIAWARIELPTGLREALASDQWGGYVDLLWTFWRGRLGVLREAAFVLAARLDYIDLHTGRRAGTSEDIGDETLRLTVGLSFRPVSGASIRLSYFHAWHTDTFKNPSREAGFQMGIATYF